MHLILVCLRGDYQQPLGIDEGIEVSMGITREMPEDA